MEFLKITPIGQNAKLGAGVSTMYRPIGKTCPFTCALLGNGCYGERGHCNIHQKRSADDTDDFEKLLDGFGLSRYCVTGDAFQDDALDVDFVQGMIDFHLDNTDQTGWMYTHRIQDWDAGGFTADTIPAGLSILASVDTPEDQAYAVANGWRYARVTDEDTPVLEEGEFLCPVDKAKREGRKPTTCRRCKECYLGTLNIVFQLQKPKPPKPRKKKTATA